MRNALNEQAESAGVAMCVREGEKKEDGSTREREREREMNKWINGLVYRWIDV